MFPVSRGSGRRLDAHHRVVERELNGPDEGTTPTTQALLVFVGVVATLVYGFLLEGLYGYTPGKYLLNLVVVKSDGSNCTVGASILRNLLWIVDALPTANLVAMVLILVTDDNQRLGDLVADTVAVKQR